MKKAVILVALACLFIAVFSGCANERETDKINIVCTTAPAYDWVTEILKGRETNFLIELLGYGGELHSYEPTVKDMVMLHDSDLFVKVGGVTESWTEEIVFSEKTKVVKLFDFLDEKDLLLNSHEGHHHGEDHDFNEYDEHIWLSLKLSQKAVWGLTESICEIDPEFSEIYKKNGTEYIEKLERLDQEYEDTVSPYKNPTIIFADRYPFSYMMEDYGIFCHAAFEGCSSDASVSAKTVATLISRIEENDKKFVLVLENSKKQVVEAINSSLKDKKVEPLVLNSCQMVKEARTFDYCEVMRENLKALKKALE